MGAVGSCEVEGLSVAVVKGGGKKDWSLLRMLMCVCACVHWQRFRTLCLHPVGADVTEALTKHTF